MNVTSSAANPAVGPPFEVKIEIGLYGATKAALNRLTNAMGALCTAAVSVSTQSCPGPPS